MLREIAAHMNSTFLAILNALVGAVVRRLFVKVEITGLEKVADYAKRHPLVLVPSHRSYFDFVIVSMAFYANYLIPPHIAARENMAFGPFGFLWRRCGAFFLRRSFDDPLYKAVFRAYVVHLVSEGVTQEFFIEGGRSRTGRRSRPGSASWPGRSRRSSAAPAATCSSSRSPSPTSGWWKSAPWWTSSRAAGNRTRACWRWCGRGSISSAASAACS
jgi:glycerol-3-phosphate O-acyltransferase